MRLAFISTHPAPYRDIFLRELVGRQDIAVEIFSQFRKDLGHPFWNLSAPPYPMRIIANRDGSKVAAFCRALRWFVFGNYDIVCWNGYPPYWYMLLPMFLCALLRRKYGIYADSVAERAKTGVKHLIKKFIIQRASFFFVPGKASENFFAEKYGVRREMICCGAYALDGVALEKDIEELRRRKACLRAKYGIGADETVFLMVANMIPSRCYPITTTAFLNAVSGRAKVRYVIVGKGPDLQAMEALAAQHSQIIVVPGCSFEEMKGLYALADVYVHGGTEPASTALVIGGIAHLPLISSRAVGCCIDCLVDGVSGCEVKDYMSAEQWEVAFNRMLSYRDLWSQMGDSARKLTRTLDVDVVLDKYCELMKTI